MALCPWRDIAVAVWYLAELYRDSRVNHRSLWGWLCCCSERLSMNKPARNETRLLLPNPSRSALRCEGSTWLLSSFCSPPHSLWSACSGPISLRNCRLMRETSELLEQLNNCIPPFLKPVRMFAETQTAWGGQEVNQGRHAVYRPEKSQRFYSGLVVWIVKRIQPLPGKCWQWTGYHSERLPL